MGNYTGSTLTGHFATQATVHIIAGSSGMTASLAFDSVNSKLVLTISPPSAYASWGISFNITGGKLGDDDRDGLTNL